MATYYKPQSPIQSGEDFIYPITTADQIMKSDKSRRLEQAGLIVADDSTKLGGRAPEYYTWTNNLLKNSNFASKYLINLNGKTEYTDIGDVFSGWIKESTSVLTLNDDYITIDNSANNNTEQIIYTDRKEEAEKLIGKTVTLAVCTSEGDIHCASGIVSTDTPCAIIYTEKFDCVLQFFSNSGSYQLARCIIKAGKTTSIKWIVLYEGAYTAETLPQPQWLHPRLEMIRMGLPTQPRNLLDNSDFRNPVNQRGVTSETDILRYAYFIDRWHSSADITTKYGLSNQGVTISGNAGIRQEIEGIESGTVLTAAVKYGGKIICVTGTIEYNGTSYKTIASYGDGTAKVFLFTQSGDAGIMISKETSASGITVEWAALYEGSYTADTLPPYVPKGYATELAACNSVPVSLGGGYGGGSLQAYPVGSIYVSATPTSPASLFGGTWEQLKDRFLLGAGSTYAAGSTGGEATHKLSINEIPSHAGHLYGNAGGLDGKGDAKGKWLAEIKSNGSNTSYGWNYANNEYYPVNRSLGGNTAHNNMPPYLAVYMWKRVS